MESRDPWVRVVSLVSGMVSGSLRVLIGHPFDTAKVHRQTNNSMPRITQLYRGIVQYHS